MSDTGYCTISDKQSQYDILSAIRDGDEDAREEMIKSNLGLVKNIASKFINYGYEWDDLLQVGSIGLMKAIERFEPSYDVMFSTYAVPLIMGEIKRYIRDNGRIKVSRSIKTSMNKLRISQETFARENGRTPHLSELAEMMEISMEELNTIMEAERTFNNIESLDDTERTVLEANVKGQVNDEEKMVNSLLLQSMLDKLKPREKQVLILRYYKDMTQKEIADILGISQVHVSRIEKKALLQMGTDLKT